MACGWNLWVWVWLVSVVVRRYIRDILIIITTFPYSTCNSFFLAKSSLFLHSFLNVFSFLFMLFLCNVIIKNLKDYRHKSLLLLNKNILHKIHFKINNIMYTLYYIYMYKVITEVIKVIIR